MSGKAAAFGGRMMTSVADQILRQFAANFTAGVAALSAQRVLALASESPSESRSKSASPPAAAPASVPASAPTPPAAGELNGLAIAWAALKDWLRGLFRRTA